MSTIHKSRSWSLQDANSPLHSLTLGLLVAALAYLSTALGSGMTVPPHNISPLWPTNAVVLMVLLSVPRRRWPMLIAVAYLVVGFSNVRRGVPIAFGVWLALGNVVEVTVAAQAVRYFFKGTPRLNTTKALIQYSLFAAILAPCAGAFIGALAATPGNYWLHWRMWFLSDGLALFTLPPAAWALLRAVPSLGRRSRSYYLELVTVTGVLIVFGYATLVAPGRSLPQVLLYPLVPFLLWSAFRFASTGTSISVVVISVLSIWGAVHGRGPFTEPGSISNVLSLQLFLLFTAAPFMVLAALVEERQQGEQVLRESEDRLRAAAKVGKMYAWEWNPTTDMVLRSADCASLLGVNTTVRETSAEDYFSLIHPDDRERLWNLVQSLTPADPVYRTQYRRFDPGGALQWLEESGCATFAGNGKMVRLVGMTADITKRKVTEEALASVSSKLINAQEQERARIARELHDDIVQRLVLVAVELEDLQHNPPELIAVSKRIGDLQEQTVHIVDDVQSLSHELHSSKLEILGMGAAMKAFCREFGAHQKVDIDFETHELPAFVPPTIALCLFRVMQEAVRNSAKHSGVRQVEVRSWGTPNEIHLTVSDSGAGFELGPAMEGTGLGLTSIGERLKLVRGTFSIKSHPQRGTTIYARVPLSAGDDSREIAG